MGVEINYKMNGTLCECGYYSCSYQLLQYPLCH